MHVGFCSFGFLRMLQLLVVTQLSAWLGLNTTMLQRLTIPAYLFTPLDLIIIIIIIYRYASRC